MVLGIVVGVLGFGLITWEFIRGLKTERELNDLISELTKEVK